MHNIAGGFHVGEICGISVGKLSKRGEILENSGLGKGQTLQDCHPVTLWIVIKSICIVNCWPPYWEGYNDDCRRVTIIPHFVYMIIYVKGQVSGRLGATCEVGCLRYLLISQVVHSMLSIKVFSKYPYMAYRGHSTNKSHDSWTPVGLYCTQIV